MTGAGCMAVCTGKRKADSPCSCLCGNTALWYTACQSVCYSKPLSPACQAYFDSALLVSWAHHQQVLEHQLTEISLVCRDLRTNLPREIMGYTDVPFTPTFMGAASRDPRRYPGHAEVGLKVPRERAAAAKALEADSAGRQPKGQHQTDIMPASPPAWFLAASAVKDLERVLAMACLPTCLEITGFFVSPKCCVWPLAGAVVPAIVCGHEAASPAHPVQHSGPVSSSSRQYQQQQHWLQQQPAMAADKCSAG